MPRLAIDVEARLASFEQGIKRIEQSASGMAGRLESAFGGLKTILASLGGAFAAATVTNAVRSFIDAADNLGKLSQRVGVTVEALSELEYAGKLADVSTEQLGDGLRKLNVNLQEAQAGSKELRAAFEAVGIAQSELAGLSADQALVRIADAFASAEDGAGKTAVAVKLLGRAGSDFIPLLNQGSAGLKAAAEEARRFGQVVSTDTARAAEEFNDNLTRLQAAAGGAGRQFATSILPALTQIAQAMADGAREGGALLGVLQGISKLGKIALFGADPSEIQKQRSFIQELKGEIATLERSAKGNGSLGSGLLDQLFYGDARQKQNKLAELRLTLQQAEQSLKRMQEAAAAPADTPAKKGQLALPSVAKAIDDDSANIERATNRAAGFFFSAFDDQFKRLRQEAAITNAELVKILQEGPEEAARQAGARRSALEGILGQTQIGRARELKDLLEELGRAGAAAPAEMQEQYAQAFEIINTELQRTNGNLDKQFDGIVDGTDRAQEGFLRLQAAIERWGDASAEEIVKFTRTGQLQFANLIDTILQDLLRLTIQQTVTRPLFTAFAGAIGAAGAPRGGGGSGGDPYAFMGLQRRALGGPVAAGTPYMVGERGPELFVPGTSGGIVSNDKLGGTTIVQNISIDSRSDISSVRMAMMQSAGLANAEMARMARRG